jgi:hypothetical protein
MKLAVAGVGHFALDGLAGQTEGVDALLADDIALAPVDGRHGDVAIVRRSLISQRKSTMRLGPRDSHLSVDDREAILELLARLGRYAEGHRQVEGRRHHQSRHV